MAVNCVLRDLNISQNHLGDGTAKAFGAALVKNTTLQVLNLASNSITDGGGESLARSLGNNENLQRMCLRRNLITNVANAWLDVEDVIVDLRENPIVASNRMVPPSLLRDLRIYFESKEKHLTLWGEYLHAPCDLIDSRKQCLLDLCDCAHEVRGGGTEDHDLVAHFDNEGEIVTRLRTIHLDFFGAFSLVLFGVRDSQSSLQILAGFERQIFCRIFGFLFGSPLALTKATHILASLFPASAAPCDDL